MLQAIFQLKGKWYWGKLEISERRAVTNINIWVSTIDNLSPSKFLKISMTAEDKIFRYNICQQQDEKSKSDMLSVSHSVVSDSATPWTVACQAPLSVGFSRQEHWSGLPFPSPGDLPDSGIKFGRRILYHWTITLLTSFSWLSEA